MGSQFSRCGGTSTQSPPTAAAPALLPDISPSDLTSYLATMEFDRDLRVFDSSLHDRTSRVFNSLAAPDAGPSLSFGTLREVIGSLTDVNQGAIRIVLQCKKDIWKNKDLLSLVNEYFEYSIQTLDFFTELDRCLKRATDRQLILRVALLHFEEETRNLAAGGCDDGTRGGYAKTLQELGNFKEAGDPFAEEYFSKFNDVYSLQVPMFEKLTAKKRRLDKKLKRVQVYRKVSSFIFAAAFTGVIICSAVAAALSAPHLLAALVGSVASAPIASVGTWFDKLWMKYVDDLKRQRDLIGAMHIGSYIAVEKLNSIRVLVDRLEVHIGSLLMSADMALEHGDAVALVIEEIKKEMDVYGEEIEELKKRAEKYSQDVRRARTVILHRIIKYPTTRN